MYNETPPFQPGFMINGLAPDGVTLIYTEYEGMEFWIKDQPEQFISGPVQARSPRLRLMRIVRNLSATAVQASQLLIPSTTTGYFDKRVNGPQTTAGAVSYVADSALPTGGVPQNYLFFIVVKGPTLVLDSGGQNTVGNIVVSTTTSGTCVTVADSAASTQQVSTKIGRCLSTLSGSTWYCDVGAP